MLFAYHYPTYFIYYDNLKVQPDCVCVTSSLIILLSMDI